MNFRFFNFYDNWGVVKFRIQTDYNGGYYCILTFNIAALLKATPINHCGILTQIKTLLKTLLYYSNNDIALF
jgi:hypothetical protein